MIYSDSVSEKNNYHWFFKENY